MIATSGETLRNRREVSVSSHGQNQIHAYDYVEEEVAVEEPKTGVVRPEPQDYVTVVGNRDRVLVRG